MYFSSIFISFLLFNVAACSSTGGNVAMVENSHTANARARENSEAAAVVLDFMRLIKEGKDADARSLLSSPRSSPGFDERNNTKNLNGPSVEEPARLDWIQVIRERNFELRSIEQVQIINLSAKVHASLGVADIENYKQAVIFILVRSESKWSIDNIEFSFDRKNSVKDVESASFKRPLGSSMKLPRESRALRSAHG